MRYWINNKIPDAPFYAVIFISEKSVDLDGYKEMDELTINLAKQQEGFLGFESAGNNNEGIFISYWKSLEAIDNWRKNSIHVTAKKIGKEKWYKRYVSQISKVEMSYEFNQME